MPLSLPLSLRCSTITVILHKWFTYCQAAKNKNYAQSTVTLPPSQSPFFILPPGSHPHFFELPACGAKTVRKPCTATLGNQIAFTLHEPPKSYSIMGTTDWINFKKRIRYESTVGVRPTAF